MSSIASRAENCIELFTRCASLLQQPESQNDENVVSISQVTDALGRFRIWAGNIGATQGVEAKSSLEFRLREAPKIAAQISGILDELIESLEDAASIFSNVRDNRTGLISTDSGDGDDEEISELQEILESVDDGIRQLFRFSILLRNNTNRDRYSKATAAGAGSPFDDQYDVSHVAHKFPCLQLAGKGWLVERLGKAISQRRQYLRYCRDHRDKTSKDHPTEPSLQSTQQLLSPVPQVPIERNPPPRTEFSRPASTLAQTQASTLVLTSGQIVEEEPNDDTQSQTSYATSVDEGSSNSNLHVIPLENVSKGLNHFECIYCWQIQATRSQKAWKKHVLTDLKPYVCTFENCELKLFADRHTWFSHELQNHRCEYQCHFCKHTPFKKSTSYESHLIHQHNMPVTKDQLPAILEMGQRVITNISPTDCPFCEDWEERLRAVNQHIPLLESLIVTPSQFQHHVGSHMDQLALFAIPRGYTEKGDADSGSAAASREDSEGTGLSETSGPSPDTIEDLNRCQEVLEELLSEGHISEHFKHPPIIPTFSMWLFTGELVKVAPLDLGTLSQKLASGNYRTARNFQIDIILMFAMHRISRTNEQDLYSDSKITDLFKNGWKVPFSKMSFTQTVEKVECKMRWLFCNARGMSSMTGKSPDAQRVTIVMPGGMKRTVQLRNYFQIRDLYTFIECSELLDDIDNVPIVMYPANYSEGSFFTVTGHSALLGPPVTYSPSSNSTIGELFDGFANPIVFVEHLADNETIQLTREKDDSSETRKEGEMKPSLGSYKGSSATQYQSIPLGDSSQNSQRDTRDGETTRSSAQPVLSNQVRVSYDTQEIMLHMLLGDFQDNWVSTKVVATLHAEPILFAITGRAMEIQTIDGQAVIAKSEVNLNVGFEGGLLRKGTFLICEEDVSFDIVLGLRDRNYLMPTQAVAVETQQSLESASDSEISSLEWTPERISYWLFENNFGGVWQETFKDLEISGSDFLQLPYLETSEKRETIISAVFMRSDLDFSLSKATGDMDRLYDLVSRISKGKGKLVDNLMQVGSVAQNEIVQENDIDIKEGKPPSDDTTVLLQQSDVTAHPELEQPIRSSLLQTSFNLNSTTVGKKVGTPDTASHSDMLLPASPRFESQTQPTKRSQDVSSNPPVEYVVKQNSIFTKLRFNKGSVIIRIDGKYVHFITEARGSGAASTTSMEVTKLLECKVNQRTPSNFEIRYYVTVPSAPISLQLDATSADFAAEIVQAINTAAVQFTAKQGLISSGEMSRLVSEHHGILHIAGNTATKPLSEAIELERKELTVEVDKEQNHIFKERFTSSQSTVSDNNYIAFKPNLNRKRSKKWAEAKSVDYGGDDWGYESDYDYHPTPLPPPVPKKKPIELLQPVQEASTSFSER